MRCRFVCAACGWILLIRMYVVIMNRLWYFWINIMLHNKPCVCRSICLTMSHNIKIAKWSSFAVRSLYETYMTTSNPLFSLAFYYFLFAHKNRGIANGKILFIYVRYFVKFKDEFRLKWWTMWKSMAKICSEKKKFVVKKRNRSEKKFNRCKQKAPQKNAQSNKNGSSYCDLAIWTTSK